MLDKPYKVFITIMLAIFIPIILSAVYEFYSISEKTQQINNFMQHSAKTTLYQMTITDDFLTVDPGLQTEGVLNFNVPCGSTFGKRHLYETYYRTDNRSEIFNKMYNTNSFRLYAKDITGVKENLGYTSLSGITSIVQSPVVLNIGTNILGNIIPSTVMTQGGVSVNPLLSGAVINFYQMDQVQKFVQSPDGEIDVYKTPLRLGLTYFDADLMGTLFVNNLDVLMRSKYEDITIGLGVNDNGFHSDILEPTKNEFNHRNPINNGVFTLLKGSNYLTMNDAQLFTGNKPDIEYKVIDMFNPSNESALVYIFGPETGSYSTKVDYFKSMYANEPDPFTGGIPTEKNIVIAKITFKADILIPYSTPIIKRLSKLGVNHFQGFINLNETTFEYTTLYAVIP
jgi:hypothetical protein